MLGFPKPAPWPPALEPGETVLLEGASSRARFWRFMIPLIALMAPLGIAFDFAISAVSAGVTPATIAVSDVVFILLLVLLVIPTTLYRLMLRNAGWMLTSHRFIQQGAGDLPREHIGALKLGAGGSVIVGRDGGDMLLRGPKFRLAYLDDAEGVRAALERLK